MRWLFLGAIALAVLPNGSIDQFNYFLNGLTFGLLFIIVAFLPVRKPRTRSTLLAVMLVCVIFSAYIILQAWPLVDHPFANPAWQDVISEGITDRGAISVAPGETFASIPSLVIPLVVFAIGLTLHQDDHAAREFWVRLTLFAGALTVIALVRHELFREAELFGTPSRGDQILTGNFFNRNTSASFFVLSCFAGVGLCLMQVKNMRWETVKRRFSSFNYFDERKYILFASGLFLTFASLVALFLTQSRGGVGFGLLALVISGTVILLTDRSAKIGRSFKLGFLAGLGALSVLAFVILGGRTIMRVDDGGVDENRVCVAESTLAGIADFPLLGTGFGTFREVFPIYRKLECGIDGVWVYAHNSWLEGYFGMGLPFAFLVLVCLFWLGRELLYGYRARRRFRFVPILIFGIVGYMSLHSTLDFPIQIPGIAILFAALLSAGVAISTSR